MSPRRPNLRNRKRIKAPRRFEDAAIVASSPRQESHEASEESSELEEEIYKSPKPKKSKSKPHAYHGKATEFNPNLPPAAFPTLDHPDYVHNGGNIAIDLESGLQSQGPKLADSEAINTGFLGRGCHNEDSDPTKHQLTMTSITPGFTRRGPPAIMQASITAQKGPRASAPSSIYGEPTDNGPRNRIWASNMARMEEAGRMNDLDRIILEMDTSDEEDADARPRKLARTASIPEFPDWDDLTVAHKLNLTDAIAELPEHPTPVELTKVMHQLRLSVSQQNELAELLIQRQDRMAREEANEQRLQEQTKEILLQGGHLSQSTFHQLVEANLYGTINDDDHLQTNLMELKKARAYLRYCGFDPALADDSWEVPSISNAASGTKAGPAQSKPMANLSSTASQAAPSSSEGPFSRRPAVFNPSQQASYPTDPRLGLVPKHGQGALPQHRPVPAHALIAQHSPAAPLSKVPVQSFRINPGSKSGDLHARYQGTSRMPQSTLPALPVQQNVSIGPAPRAIDNALPKSRSASSSLPTPQEEHSSPAGSRSPVRKDSLAARRNHTLQRSGSPNAEESASHAIGGTVGNADSVNKKKRKKDAALVGLKF